MTIVWTALAALCFVMALAGLLTFVIGVLLLIDNEEPLFVLLLWATGAGVLLLFSWLGEMILPYTIL